MLMFKLFVLQVLFALIQAEVYYKRYFESNCGDIASASSGNDLVQIFDTDGSTIITSGCVTQCTEDIYNIFNALTLLTHQKYHFEHTFSKPMFAITIQISFAALSIINPNNLVLSVNGATKTKNLKILGYTMCDSQSTAYLQTITVRIPQFNALTAKIDLDNATALTILLRQIEITTNECLPGCSTCENYVTCSACLPTAQQVPGNRCVSQCALDQVIVSGVCMPCDSSCATCFGTDQYSCLSCQPSFLLGSDFQCNFTSAICNPSPLINNSLFGTCIELSKPPNLLCSDYGPVTLECNKCKDVSTQYLSNGNCAMSTSNCPFGYHFDSATHSCTLNLSNCLQQIGNQCVLCERTYQITGSYQCTQMTYQNTSDDPSGQKDYSLDTNIPVGFFDDSNFKIFASCNASCKECNGPTRLDCLSCNSGSVINGMCGADCGDARYYDYASETCLSCHSQCATCYGPSIYNCLLCSNGQVLYNQVCIPNCPSNTGLNKYIMTCFLCVGNCFICISSCSTCLDEKTCTECNLGYELVDSKGCLPLFDVQQQLDQSNPQNLIIINIDSSVFWDDTILFPQNVSFQFQPEYANTYSITQITQYQLSVAFTFSVPIPSSQTLKLTVLNKNSATVFNSKTIEVSFFGAQAISYPPPPPPPYEPSSTTVSASTALSDISTATTNAVVATTFVIILTKGFPIFSTLVDLSELFYLLSYLEFKKPYNLNKFLDSFSTIQMRFFPNIFSAILGDFPHQELEQLFKEKKQTAHFLDNTGPVLTMLLMLMGIHLILYLLQTKLFIPKFKQFSKPAQVALDHIQQCSYIQLLETIYLQIVYACFLQLRHVEISSFPLAINFILLIICFITIVPFPFIIYYVLQKNKYPHLHYLIKSYHLEMHHPGQRCLIYLRKCVFSCVIILGFGYPFVQLPIVLFTAILIPTHIILTKPYENLFWNKKIAVIEILFAITQVLFFPLLDSFELKEQSREAISWVIFSAFYLIVLIEICNLNMVVGAKVKEFLAKMQSARKVHPISITSKEKTIIILEEEEQLDNKSKKSKQIIPSSESLPKSEHFCFKGSSKAALSNRLNYNSANTSQ